MPNVREDLAALPSVFRKPLMWLPFGVLLVAFFLELARQNEMLPEGAVADLGILFVQLTLPPTSLFVFFIGGFLAPRASYLVGALLGVFDALLITILVLLEQTDFEETGMGDVAQGLVPLWGIAILVGIFAAGFAAWYRRFLRSSQERAKANRAIREQEQARKAKEQARADKQAAREAQARPLSAIVGRSALSPGGACRRGPGGGRPRAAPARRGRGRPPRAARCAAPRG